MPSLDRVSVVSDAHSDAGLSNQDSVFATQSGGQALLAVFDGHGEYGDQVSQSLCTIVQTTADRPDALTNIGDTVRELCQKIEIHALPDNWASSSGSTVLVAGCWNGGCIVGYAGDSAVAVVWPDRVERTEAHRVTNLAERQRVAAMGAGPGVIDAEAGYLIHPELTDTQGRPRLCANTRGCGDLDFAAVGLISAVEIVQFSLEGAVAVVAASDGLFDYLSLERVATIVREAANAGEQDCALLATNSLLDEIEGAQGGLLDDCAIAFLMI